MSDFSNFDKQIDLKSLQQEAAEIKKNGGVGEYEDLPEGTYRVKCESLEIGETGPKSKGGPGRPMLKAMFRIIEGEHKKQCMFMNRVLYGTKNDANMIASAEGWLESLEPSDDVGPVIFQGYNKFADLVLDIADDISELEYEVDYDPDAFNSITITEVYE